MSLDKEVQAYIEEVDEYIATAKSLIDAEKMDFDPEFRKWRPRAEEMIRSLRRDGYPVSCKLHRRDFKIMYPRTGTAKQDHMQVFNLHLADTITELEVISERLKNGRCKKLKDSEPIDQNIDRNEHWLDGWIKKSTAVKLFLIASAGCGIGFGVGISISYTNSCKTCEVCKVCKTTSEKPKPHPVKVKLPVKPKSGK